MFSKEVVMLSLALAMDAAIVSFAYGLMVIGHDHHIKIKRGFLSASTFGIFQAVMLWMGSWLGRMVSFSSIGHLFQFLVAGVFIITAIKCFQESLSKEEKNIEWGLYPLLGLAFATSIDALAAGVSAGTLPFAYEVSVFIGLVTFLMCSVFFVLSHFLRTLPENWLLRLSGLIFLVLAVQIIYSYFD